MTDKVLVEIFIPAAGASYDVYIPLASKMGDVLLLVAHALSELSAGKYQAGEDAVLCDARTGSVYDMNMPVAELSICNGSRLMLI